MKMHLKMQQLLSATALLLQLLLVLLPASPAAATDAAAANILPTATIAGIHDGLRNNRFTCSQLISVQIARAQTLNSVLRAFIRFDRQTALRQAAAKDATWSGSLHCVPIIVKDNVDVAGVPTTNGAAAFVNMTAVSDAEIVARLKANGAIIIGKANMAEMSDSGIDSNSTLGGVCSNPWSLTRSCLGSSGGSAAAVAAGLAVIGVGTDTEGSVIGPCIANGLVCIRPSNTAVYQAAMRGVYPAFSRQDSLGLMARTTEDFMAVHDAVYNTTFASEIGSNQNLTGNDVVVLGNFLASFSLPGIAYSPNSEIVQFVWRAATRLQQLGANLSNFTLNTTELGQQLTSVIQATAAKPGCSKSCMIQDINSYLASYNATGPFRQTQDLLQVQHLLPSSYQAKLSETLNQTESDICSDSSNSSCGNYVQARATILAILEQMIGNATVAAMPFTAKLPQVNGATVPLPDQITPALNPYTGWPSVTFPVGFASNGMPVGIVMVAREGEEMTLMRMAHAYSLRFRESRSPNVEVKAAVAAYSASFAAAAAAAAVAAVVTGVW